MELANDKLVELLLRTPLGEHPSAPIAPTPAEVAQMRGELLLARDKFGSTALQMARESGRPYFDRDRKASLERILELLERACEELGVPTEEVEEEKENQEENEEQEEMEEEQSTSSTEMETSSDTSEDDEEESDDKADGETMDTVEPVPGAASVDVAGAASVDVAGR